MRHAIPFTDHDWSSDLELECIPNRNSLRYESTYGLVPPPPSSLLFKRHQEGEDVDDITCKTMFRGTLRYQGFSSLMYVFQQMGLFDMIEYNETDIHHWDDLLHFLQEQKQQNRNHPHDDDEISFFFLQCSNGNVELAKQAQYCWNWLIRNNPSLPTNRHNNQSSKARVVDAFCHLLQSNLQYETNNHNIISERDMIVMQHNIIAEFDDGNASTSTIEEHISSLQVFGDDDSNGMSNNDNDDTMMTAMCKTVGYPAAAAASNLLLNDNKNKGVLLPTKKEIYLPILEQLQSVGIITFNEKVNIIKKNKNDILAEETTDYA